jgi:hypothetical protein
MAIVSVAIVLSFHLKSEPTPLGKLPKRLSLQYDGMLTMCCRKAIRATSGNNILVTIHGMHAIGAVELYPNNFTLQSAASIGANGVEDAGRIHCGIVCHRCDVHTVSLNERRKVKAWKQQISNAVNAVHGIS